MIAIIQFFRPFILMSIFTVLAITLSSQNLSFAQAPFKSEKWIGAELHLIESTLGNSRSGKKNTVVLKEDGTIDSYFVRVNNGDEEVSVNTRWSASPNGGLTIKSEMKGTANKGTAINVSWTQTTTSDLKLNLNSECSGNVKIEATWTANGKTSTKKLAEGSVRFRVVFASKSDELSNTEMPHPHGGGGLSDAERQFDREVFDEIRRIISENPNSWAITHQNIADQIRRGRGQNGGRKETPQMVAVEHYFFGLTLSPIASLVPADGAEIAHWWESIRAIGGNPGPRGNFQGRIEFWGGAGLNGWQVK